MRTWYLNRQGMRYGGRKRGGKTRNRSSVAFIANLQESLAMSVSSRFTSVSRTVRLFRRQRPLYCAAVWFPLLLWNTGATAQESVTSAPAFARPMYVRQVPVDCSDLAYDP